MNRHAMPRMTLGLMSARAGSRARQSPDTVIINDGPYHSYVVATRPRFRWRGRTLEVLRWFPRRGFVVTECYRQFHAPILPFRLPAGVARGTLRRRGFQRLTLYVKDGCYFRRAWAHAEQRGHPTLRPEAVWQRAGEFFRPDNERRQTPLS